MIGVLGQDSALVKLGPNWNYAEHARYTCRHLPKDESVDSSEHCQGKCYMNELCFRPGFWTVRLYWARDNLRE